MPVAQEIIRKPFEPKGDDKRNFRDWVKEQFPKLKVYGFGGMQSYPEFEERLAEIHEGAMLVLNRFMRVYRPGDPTYEYYRRDFENVPKAFASKNPKEYAKRIDDFLGGIDWE